MPDAAPYVVAGDWVDDAWRAAAARRVRTTEEAMRFAAGPRAHPWGPLAVGRVQGDGREFVFPSAAAADAWQAAQPADAGPAADAPPPAPDATPQP